jgi:hypothetical protein
MDASTWIVIAIIAVVVIIAVLVIAAAARSRRRHRVLHEQFGDEYDRTIEGTDKRRDGERELQDRIDLRNRLDIRPLTPVARDRYTAQWHSAQERFVDEPSVAVIEADALVNTVMRERGYPVDDWEQQSAMVSVDHPHIVNDYRVAHDIAGRSRSNNASTDDLREAFLRYRSLFDALLETDEGGAGAGVGTDDTGEVRDTTVRR